MEGQQIIEVYLSLKDVIPQFPSDSGLFIVADNINDEIYICGFAEAMIKNGLRHFDFTGKYGNLWDLLFDETYIKLCPDSPYEDVALTMYWKKREDFDEAMECSLQDYLYLIYDNPLKQA
ncbi:hypothetical protein [Eubacterium pyruvativorans]|uniref:hypothetical protein n=1 Tax=Eubacterium pyruvativorans TaxID=155865 RepID=UPI0008867507|nr:hypothetical protein [Eubacterium pyruvativorans]MDD6708202.1 hypothetical protein [Eubacterium pyruvativorans]MDY4050123.1 hypothetical protein [Eubacterium pyruvativorans]SDE75337.1 hypothetical protein SAMN04487889_103125 [Eubacterium pyruvativorans]